MKLKYQKNRYLEMLSILFEIRGEYGWSFTKFNKWGFAFMCFGDEIDEVIIGRFWWKCTQNAKNKKVNLHSGHWWCQMIPGAKTSTPDSDGLEYDDDLEDDRESPKWNLKL